MMRATAELAIVGHIATRAAGGSVGTRLVAGNDEAGDLRLVGQVGTGMSQRERRRLLGLLDPIEIPIPRCETHLQNRCAMGGTPVRRRDRIPRVHPGQLLRHPSYKGLRDVTAADTRVPTPA